MAVRSSPTLSPTPTPTPNPYPYPYANAQPPRCLTCHDAKSRVEKEFRAAGKLLETDAWLRMMAPLDAVRSPGRMAVDEEVLAALLAAAPHALAQ